MNNPTNDMIENGVKLDNGLTVVTEDWCYHTPEDAEIWVRDEDEEEWTYCHSSENSALFFEVLGLLR